MNYETELDRLRTENARLRSEKAALERKVSKLEHTLAELLEKVFGRKSEGADPERILAEAAADGAKEPLPASPPHAGEAPDGETPETKPRKRKPHGWRKPPADLPRKRVEIWPSKDECTCDRCGGEKVSIGSPEITARYDYVPASVTVVETVRHRLRCPRCQDGTVIAPLPPPPVGGERGRAEAGLLAQIVVSKFNDHLPLHRQEEIFAREGAPLARSTLCDYVRGTAELLRPIADMVLDEVLSGPIVGLDETAIRIVFDREDPKNGTRNGRIWAYRGRPGEVFFQASETKAKADVNGPLVLLADYKGMVQADAAGTFDDLFLDGTRIEIGCNVHARRKFYEARKSHPKEAAYALAAYKKLYEIEARFRDAGPEELLAARQRETKPLLDAFDAWIDEVAASAALVPGTPLATAVGYSRNHRKALRRFLGDPRLSPDNNAVERALRLVAVGRKNWLFAGSEDAAHDAAALYSLVASCRELGVEPWAYLRDVIQRRATDPAAPVAALTPRAWHAARQTQPASEPPK